MMSKGSKLPIGLAMADTRRAVEMLRHFKAQMGTNSLDVADLSLDLQALSHSLAHWEAYYAALQDSQAKPSKKRPRTVKPRTSTRRKA